MKKALSLLFLAALTIGLLGSCSKINERLDNLEKKVSGIENEQIASINSQISGITSSIADLGTIRENISGLKTTAEAQAKEIAERKKAEEALGGRVDELEEQAEILDNQVEDLKEADIALGERIDELKNYIEGDLKDYAKIEWVQATFSTLEQYEATCDTIAKIDARIGALDAKLSKNIKDCADSLTRWVNKTFEGYYTAAEMDAALELMQADIDSARAAGKITDAKADSIAAELTVLAAAVDTAKANIRAEYRVAIDTAIKTGEGKLTKALTDAITEANGKIESLAIRVGSLETKVDALFGRFEALEGMIQSVTIVPAYSDESVKAKDSILYLDIIVEPARVVNTLKIDNFKVLVNKVKAQTKAVNVDTVSLSAFEVENSARGTITAMANISSELPVQSGKALTIAVNVKTGLSDITTKFYPVEFESNVKTETQGESMMVTIEAGSKFPDLVKGYIPVADGFDASKPTTIKAGGIGTAIFDMDATAKIIENAGDADNIFFSFENVTARLSINADKVIEIKMNTAGENGGAVFSEDNACGEVIINIPLSEDVVYLKSVTLVDNAGNPIEGGVVPGSEKIENGNLSFKVNHFSMYAIDYVTNDEFVAVTGASLDTTSAELKVGDTLRLKATIAPGDATNKKVTWSSSDTTKVTVDNTGKITAKAAGTATVTVTTEDGGKTATCTVTVKDDTSSGPLPGVFSVSPTKKVRFSPGNLYAKKDDSGNWNWNFYDKQYACNSLNSLCNDLGRRTPTSDDNEIDLFSWGYGDWSTDPITKSYLGRHTSEGEPFEQTEDWGSVIDDKGTWRTLTEAEWCYLFAYVYDYESYEGDFDTESPRYNLFKIEVTVCGHTNCVVLLPDDWEWGGTVGDNWQTEYNEETTVKWSSMEAAGAVCLPAAGYRFINYSGVAEVYEVGGCGLYWTSSTCYLPDDYGFDEGYSYYLYIARRVSSYIPASLTLGPDAAEFRQNGHSVRLVTDVPAAK